MTLTLPRPDLRSLSSLAVFAAIVGGWAALFVMVRVAGVDAARRLSRRVLPGVDGP